MDESNSNIFPTLKMPCYFYANFQASRKFVTMFIIQLVLCDNLPLFSIILRSAKTFDRKQVNIKLNSDR